MVEPLIPQNTGNIGRTCAGMWSTLHLVEPMAFRIDDTKVKRAGLDYWPYLDLKIHAGWREWLGQVPARHRIHLIETRQDKTFDQIPYEPGDWLVFGKETKGLPQELLAELPGQGYSIPFPGQIRSFNVANAVAIVLAEGYRQIRSKGLLSSQ